MTYTGIFRSLAGLSLALVLTACGGGGGGGGNSSSSSNGETKPVAQATVSPGETVTLGQTLTFDASNSTPRDKALSYQWTLIARPDGSAAQLGTSNTVSASLTPDQAGTWTLSLIVQNGQTKSDPKQVSVTVTALPVPVALIRPINGALPSIGIQLDGSGSKPAQGHESAWLTHVWELLEKPADSTAELDDPSSAYPRFTPDKEGNYRVQLHVQHGDLVSEPVEQTIEVRAETAPPTAVGKVLTESPVRGQLIQLDASESSDPEGQPLKYFWRWGSKDFGQSWPTTGRPFGSRAVIENPASAKPSFVADFPGTYQLWLIAYNGKRYSIAGVSVVVAKATGTPNTKPVAVISPDRPSYTWENEPSIGSPVTLGPTSSYDQDGDTLTYEWEWVSTPDGYDRAANSTFATGGWGSTFNPTLVGSYIARLRAHDGTEWSDWVTATWKVLTGANVAPTAKVKTAAGSRVSSQGGRTILDSTQVGALVTLDGSESTGGNGDQVFYTWEMLLRPEGSKAQLSDVGATYPTFTADVEGPYLVRLRVTDAYGAQSRGYGEILIVARINNSPPVLRPVWGTTASNLSKVAHTDEQPILLGNQSGSNKEYAPQIYISPNSLDPDGDDVDTLISLTNAPVGGWPETRQWTVSPTSTIGGSFSSNDSRFFLPTVSGNYTFQLIGSDSVDQSALHMMTLPMATLADYPSLLLRRGGSSPNFPLYTFETRNFDHLLFPYARSIDNSFSAEYATWSYSTGSPITEGFVERFKLNAPAGQSYTIIDVKAESEDANGSASFIGLTEGQVIAAGTAVEFTLNVTRWTEDRVESDPATPYPKARWSFRVKEKPEWTFSVETTLHGKWYEATHPNTDP